MSNTTVLIVEDNDEVAAFLEQAISEAGYTPLVERDGVAGLAAARTNAVDLILMDVMLPRMDGLRACALIRHAEIRTPILIITARDSVEDKIAGLDSGADDYIVKPFEIGELLARMRALLRRSSLPPVSLRVADLVVDPANRRVTRGDKVVFLSSTEYNLLEALLRSKGQVLDRASILQAVWDYDFGGNDNVLEVYVSHLRSKIDRDRRQSLIRTVRGVGYLIDDITDEEQS